MAALSRQSGGVIMSRVIAVMACGFTVAACSASVPSLNFLNSSPPDRPVRFESEPAGAEVKTPSGQSCRTPCELTIQVAPELSVTFALAGYQSETVSVRSEEGSVFFAETDTEPGSCGASHHPGCAREEEDQEAARGGVGRGAGKRIRGIGVGRTAVNVRSVSGSRSPASRSRCF